MKKVSLYPVSAILLASLLLFSCEKEQPVNEKMIGKWAVESLTQVNYQDDVKETSISYYFQTDEFYFEFNEGGTGIIMIEGELPKEFSWSAEISIIHLMLENAAEPLTWNINIEKESLMMSYSETRIVENTTLKNEYIYMAKRFD